ncbi:Disks large homolog 1 [Lemmus lemmus]
MPVKKKDTDRALSLLEDYCKKLRKPEEQLLKNAVQRVMSVFKSSLFQALLVTSRDLEKHRSLYLSLPGTVCLEDTFIARVFWFLRLNICKEEFMKYS